MEIVWNKLEIIFWASQLVWLVFVEIVDVNGGIIDLSYSTKKCWNYEIDVCYL